MFIKLMISEERVISSQLVDTLIDRKEKSLKLISRIDQKMLSYSLDGANLLKVDKLSKSFLNLSQMDDDFVGFSGNYIEDLTSKKVWIMNEDLTDQK